MSANFYPQIDVARSIGNTKLDTFATPARLDGMITENRTPTFKETFVDMAKDLNDTVKAPDQVLQDAVLGNGADVHDVMIAVSKAELGVNIATQVTTKVVQAYDKIMAIQV